ncbi:MAG: TolC family protein [Clostridia bacterium]|nr:TolC family protein [Clostridia bacterium]
MKSTCTPKTVGLILAFVVVISGIAGAAQNGSTMQIDLPKYIAAYVQNSSEVSTARESAEDAQTQWKRAVDEKKALLTIEELKNAAETKRLALQETLNNVALKAVQAYVGLGQAERDLEARQVSLSVATERLRVAKLRYEAGLTTKDSVLEQENSYLSATDSLVKAQKSVKQSKQDFCENAGMALVDKIVLTTDVSSLFTGAGEHDGAAILKAAGAASSTCFSAAAAEDLARRKNEALQDPMIATKTEREAAEKTYKDAKSRLADAEKSLTSSVADALASLESLVRSLDMQTISAQLAAANLEVAKIRFSHGEMLQYEMDNEISSANQASYKVIQAETDLFVQLMKIHALTGGDVASLAAK